MYKLLKMTGKDMHFVIHKMKQIWLGTLIFKAVLISNNNCDIEYQNSQTGVHNTKMVSNAYLLSAFVNHDQEYDRAI